MCPLCADCSVPNKFRGNNVSGARGEFKRIIDQVTTNRDATTVRFFFLWMMINDNSIIHDCLVGRDVLNQFRRKEEDCVGPIGDAWFALCQPMYLFAHRWDPGIDMVVVWWDQLDVYIVGLDVLLNHLVALVIHRIQCWLVVACMEYCEYFGAEILGDFYSKKSP